MKLLLFFLSMVISFGLPLVLGAPKKEYDQPWYKKLKQPAYALPDAVFIVIFPVFYALEGIGVYFFLLDGLQTASYLYVVLYLFSAVLSGVWSRLFFAYKRCDLSLVAFMLELPVSWLILAMLVQLDYMIAIFFIPRVLWGMYALFVNLAIYRLNKPYWDKQKN